MKGFKFWKISAVVGFWLLDLNQGYGELIDLGTLPGWAGAERRRLCHQRAGGGGRAHR